MASAFDEDRAGGEAVRAMHESRSSTQEEAAMGRVAMIVDELFEDSELRVPYDRLKAAGHEVVIVGREGNKRLSGKRGKETVTTDQAIDDVSASQFDALVIPGGYSP